MSTTLFNVKIFELEGTAKPTNCISVEEEITDDVPLSTIRDHLVKDKKLDSDKARLAFCTKDGSRMVDGTKFGVYQRLIKGPAKKKTTKKEGDKVEGATDGAESTDVAKAEDKDDEDEGSSKLKVYDIYLEAPKTKKKKMTELSESTKELLNSKLDMNLVKNQPALIAATLKELSSTYKHESFKALASGEVVTGATMSEKDWTIVLRNTNFLNGQRIVFSKNANGSRTFQRIDRAPFSAFKIKARHIDSLDVADSSIVVKQEYRIPIYVTNDESYVNVFETASALSNSMASSSFSQRDIEASAGGGLFGASLSVKGGFSDSESKALARSSSSSTRSMNITYNFPRAILHLDPRGLELTDECARDLNKVDDADSLVQFHHDYGHFFAGNVQLGGRLFASEHFSSEEEGSSTKTANAMKWSAAASFSYGSFSASGSYSKENNSVDTTENKSSSMSSQLSWEAQGGDTILCNNPPAWCPSVKPFQNWRVINQKDVMPIGNFIGQFRQWKHIPDKFAGIMKGSIKKVPCKFRLKANNVPGVNDEYYGLRKNKDRERLFYVWDKYSDELKDNADGWKEKELVSEHVAALKSRMKEDSFTVCWEEYVGIDVFNNGCSFEVEVETILGRAPRLELNVPYRIYNRAFNMYLAADDHGSWRGRYFAYCFYCKENRASNWVFRIHGDRARTGVIEDGQEVELTLLDDNDQPVGFVQRFTGDMSTLLVSHYGVEDGLDKTTRHDAHVIYE
ncbi:hypothetical protein TWF703_003401 [Orbilia oligospora]|uniref:MACPF-like domain-containing protein n=2 Tax=Orbilia oligospora TaxID=2813651 RepID=A0A7C8JU92_ORBOL|nr:hypothetical protein TWF703_003401 [Orbilia oligospora]